MRDNQISKLYRAEDAVFSPNGRKLISTSKCNEFINKIIRQGYYNDNGGFRIIRSRYPKIDSQCATWNLTGNLLTLPPWAKCKQVIIHEMSHALCDHIAMNRHKFRETVEPHGKEFCTIYLNMVHCYISKKIALELEESFTKFGIKYTRANLNF